MSPRPSGLDPAEDDWRRRASELTDPARVAPWPDREEARRVGDLLFAEFGQTIRESVVVEDLELGTGSNRRRARFVRPLESALGTVVFIHGGGFAFGSIDESANLALAAWRASCIPATVLQVEYRLAPEHPFPAGLDDVVAAVDAVRAVTEAPDSIVLDGVSAGANLALGAAIVLRDRGLPVAGLVLEMPSPDLRPEAPWLAEYAPLNGVAEREIVRGYYLAGAEPTNPLVSPSVGDLRGLPPVHVMTAELDPLREVGEHLVQRLRALDVDVSASRRLGALHGSLTLTGRSRSARLWNDEAAAAARDLLGNAS